jgi:hypothetical protein
MSYLASDGRRIELAIHYTIGEWRRFTGKRRAVASRPQNASAPPARTADAGSGTPVVTTIMSFEIQIAWRRVLYAQHIAEIANSSRGLAIDTPDFLSGTSRCCHCRRLPIAIPVRTAIGGIAGRTENTCVPRLERARSHDRVRYSGNAAGCGEKSRCQGKGRDSHNNVRVIILATTMSGDLENSARILPLPPAPERRARNRSARRISFQLATPKRQAAVEARVACSAGAA